MNPSSWRLIVDGPTDGAVNMATDRAILEACETGKAPPTLRLYRWSQPTMTVGYFQKPERELNLAKCRERGVPVAPRPTGGRGILHQDELTYSLVAPIPHSRFPDTLDKSFRIVSDALLFALAELGIEGSLMTGKGERAELRSPSCFASLSHGEIAVQGKKLIGSAQRRLRHAFLQQGSLPITCDHEFINSLFLFDRPEAAMANLEILKTRTTTVSELLDAPPAPDRIAQALESGFQRLFGASASAGTLSLYEQGLRDSILASENFACTP